MTNTTTQLTADQIAVNIEGIELTLSSFEVTPSNAEHIASLKAQLEQYKVMYAQRLNEEAINFMASLTEPEIEDREPEHVTITISESGESLDSETDNNNNTIKGENNIMTNNTTKSNTEAKKVIKSSKQSVTFTEADLQKIEGASVQLGKVAFKMGVTAPRFSHFTGNATKMIVDPTYSQFVLTSSTNEEDVVISFSMHEGKTMIDYLMVVLPTLYPKFMESTQFKALDKMNLKGRLTAKAKVKGKKTRQTVLLASLELNDIYVVKDDIVLGKLVDFSQEELEAKVIKEVREDGKSKVVISDSVRFFIAKDTNVANLNNQHTLYQKMTGSLAYHRFATGKGKRVEEIKVIKETNRGGMRLVLEEPQKVLVLDELCTFNGSGSLAFGEEINQVLVAGVFNEVFVVNKEDGQLEDGTDVSAMDTFSYKTYTRSVAQSRTKGAIGYKTFEDVITYFLATGQDERAFGKRKEINGQEFGVMDVAKGYKRFMVGASNGLNPEKGLLSRFSKGVKVEHILPGEGKVIGEIQPGYIVLTNKRGEKYTIAYVEDFFSNIPVGQDFLLNVLDKDNAFVGVEKFKEWGNPLADGILKRNVTDGQGWFDKLTYEELFNAKAINSNNSLQGRATVAIKGALVEDNNICSLFGANMVLTEGMMKAENIIDDIKEHGLQLFVVGQRKETNDGVWIASQATQQFGLTTDELKQGVLNSINLVKSSIDDQLASNILAMLNADEEEQENEFATVDFVRLADEFGDVWDEQYIKDELVSLAVKKLNKLLDSKLFLNDARTRYMFTDPIAIYNAAKAGRYTLVPEDAVLAPYEVVAPSKDENGEYYLKEGEAISVRFPVTVTHEVPVVKAVYKEEYMEFVREGAWQGITFFDAFSWVVATQAGADHDGDTSILIFNPLLVNARKRKNEQGYGGLEVLPFIDAYVKYDENGVAVKFDTGCPTYMTEATKAKQVTPEAEVINGFTVQGSKVYFDPKEFEGPKAVDRRREFLEVVAGISRHITLTTIESTLIGIIANRAMVIADLLTRDVLTNEERQSVENDLLVLCTAGRWELDRPKHGGAYLEMPLVKELFANFEAISLSDDQLELTNEAKFALLEDKGVYRHLFEPITDNDNVIVGFNVRKPQWLASQKDEFGIVREDSQYEQIHVFAGQQLAELCESFKEGHFNSAKNNIRVRVLQNMEVAPSMLDQLKYEVAGIYSAYTAKENSRSAAEKMFNEQAVSELKKAGVFGKKNLKSLTKAKKANKIRNAFEAQVQQFKMDRDLYKTELRKAMYEAAKEMNLDVRALVGALYLVINDTKTNGKAACRRDGREYRFVASNGYIALPFEVFKEEMSSLISGKISETYFIPQDLTFTLLQTSLVPEEVAPTTSSSNAVQVRVLNPIANTANKKVSVNRTVRVAIKLEEQQGEVRPVMYFLNKTAQVTDETQATNANSAFKGWAPENYMTGIYEVTVKEIQFNATGKAAVVRF